MPSFESPFDLDAARERIDGFCKEFPAIEVEVEKKKNRLRTKYAGHYDNLEDFVDYKISELLGLSKINEHDDGRVTFGPRKSDEIKKMPRSSASLYEAITKELEKGDGSSSSEFLKHLKSLQRYINHTIISKLKSYKDIEDAEKQYEYASWLKENLEDFYLSGLEEEVNLLIEISAEKGYGPACLECANICINEGGSAYRAIYLAARALRSSDLDEEERDDAIELLREYIEKPPFSDDIGLWKYEKKELMFIIGAVKEFCPDIDMLNPDCKFIKSLLDNTESEQIKIILADFLKKKVSFVKLNDVTSIEGIEIIDSSGMKEYGYAVRVGFTRRDKELLHEVLEKTILDKDLRPLIKDGYIKDYHIGIGRKDAEFIMTKLNTTKIVFDSAVASSLRTVIFEDGGAGVGVGMAVDNTTSQFSTLTAKLEGGISIPLKNSKENVAGLH